MPQRAVGVNVDEAGGDPASGDVNPLDIRAQVAGIGEARDAAGFDHQRLARHDAVGQDDAAVHQRHWRVGTANLAVHTESSSLYLTDKTWSG